MILIIDDTNNRWYEYDSYRDYSHFIKLWLIEFDGLWFLLEHLKYVPWLGSQLSKTALNGLDHFLERTEGRGEGNEAVILGCTSVLTVSGADRDEGILNLHNTNTQLNCRRFLWPCKIGSKRKEQFGKGNNVLVKLKQPRAQIQCDLQQIAPWERRTLAVGYHHLKSKKKISPFLSTAREPAGTCIGPSPSSPSPSPAYILAGIL